MVDEPIAFEAEAEAELALTLVLESTPEDETLVEAVAPPGWTRLKTMKARTVSRHLSGPDG
jgi:hypothetical protein